MKNDIKGKIDIKIGGGGFGTLILYENRDKNWGRVQNIEHIFSIKLKVYVYGFFPMGFFRKLFGVFGISGISGWVS